MGSQWYASSETTSTGVLSAVQTKSGLSSPANAPANDSSHIVLQFPIDSTASYNMLARISVPANEDYDFWYKINNGTFQRFNSNVSIPNMGFENGLTGWTTINNQNSAVISVTNVAGEPRTGNGALKIYNPNNYPGTSRRVRVSSIPIVTTKGKVYEFSFWVKSTTNASISLSTGPNEFQYQAAQTTNTTWKQIIWTTTARLDTTTFQFNVGADSTVYFIDDVTIREVNAGLGWQWVNIGKTNFTKGINTLTITYGNGGGTKIDKVLFATTNTTFSGVGSTGSNCSIQPVTIISFTGVINSNNKVDLEWKTSNEINLSHYSVERYTDNNVFVEVGKVNALNSLVSNSYNFNDTSIINPSRSQYYRLKLVDAYGQFYYSTTLKIAPGGPVKLKVTPNPVRNNIVIAQHTKAEKGAHLSIYTIDGKLLKTVEPDLQSVETRIDIEKLKLPSGTYIIHFLNNGVKDVFKFSKM